MHDAGGVPAMLAEGYRPRRALDPDAKYGPYWRRQYVFAAATMPAITYSDVGSQIQKAHPDAVWVATELLHTSKPSVEHAWREVSGSRVRVFAFDGAAACPHLRYHTAPCRPHPAYLHLPRSYPRNCGYQELWTCQRAAALTGSWHPLGQGSLLLPCHPLAHGSLPLPCVQVSDSTFADTLLDVLRSDSDHAAGRGKTLVFAADGAAAERAAAVLAGGGVRHVVYHKSRPMAEQAAALEELRGREGAVMVCTDAAARGLDVQGITHVVQVGVRVLEAGTGCGS